MSFRREVKETAQAGVLFWVLAGMVVLFVVVVGFMVTGGRLAFLPFVRQQETVINRSSQGYVEAKQMQLLSLAQDVQRLEGEIRDGRAKGQDVRSSEAQLSATLDRMQAEASLLQRDQVPGPAAAALQRYGRGI
jgi:hypothetical protein